MSVARREPGGIGHAAIAELNVGFGGHDRRVLTPHLDQILACLVLYYGVADAPQLTAP